MPFRIEYWRACGINYRPQGKVMFSETSVSHSFHGRGGVICIHKGSLYRGGVCIGGGQSAFRGSLPTGGLHPGGLPTGGESAYRGSASSGSHCSGRYASYWNAFLFAIKISE